MSKKAPSYSRTNDRVILGRVSKILKLRGATSVEQAFEAASNMGCSFPCDMSDVFCLKEKIPFYMALRHPKSVPLFWELMFDIPDGFPVIVTDLRVNNGDDALILVSRYPHYDTTTAIVRWLGCSPSNYHTIIHGDGDGVVIAAPLKTFV